MKESRDSLPLKTQALLASIAMLLLACVCIAGMFVAISDYNNSKSNYEDFEYREYIFDHCKRLEDYEVGSSNLIYVQGQEKPLKINNLLSTREVEMKLDSLKSGDKIYCYIREKSRAYEVAEIGKNKPFFSLKEYNNAYKKNGIAFSIIFPILAIGCGVSSAIFFLEYRKEKSSDDIYNQR